MLLRHLVYPEDFFVVLGAYHRYLLLIIAIITEEIKINGIIRCFRRRRVVVVVVVYYYGRKFEEERSNM